MALPVARRRRSLLNLLTTPEPLEDPPRPKTAKSFQPVDAPTPPRPVSEYAARGSRLSSEMYPDEVVEDVKTRKDRSKRLSFFRNFSETHLSARAKEQGRGQDAPPLPRLHREYGSVNAIADADVPAITKTSPTMGDVAPSQDAERERKVRPSLFQRATSRARSSEQGLPRKPVDEKRQASLRWRKSQGRSSGLDDLARLSTAHVLQAQASAPPSYGDESNSALALPMPAPRFSESSQTDGSGSSGDQIYGATTTTHTVSTHTTFFKLRRNKNRNSLFPLPVKSPLPNEELSQSPPLSNGPATPRASTSAIPTQSPQTSNDTASPPGTILLQRRHTEASPTKSRINQDLPPLPLPHQSLAKSSLSFAEPRHTLSRNDSQRSRNSTTSSPLRPPLRLGMRDRASTASSFGRSSHDMDAPSMPTGSARNSSSTNGRSSLGGFLSLARFRQGSGPDSPRFGTPGTNSKTSFALSREALFIPEREEGDTPGKYLERLEAAVARSMIAGIMSKSADPFAQAVLRSYTRRFPFFTEPIDMSLRKFLLEAELPKETQQVDRVIQAFADRYHECNPGIFLSPDQAYIIAFSLMMLHTDAFNKNNKRKMQRSDYIKNTSGQHVADDILACFYDNICYTPFVHYEEEVDINGQRVLPFQAKKKSKLKVAIAGDAAAASKKALSGPIDPYNLLVDQKLDLLRPAIADCITLDDPYNYRSSQTDLDPDYLQRAFTHTGVLQIISARSRPTAYESQLTNQFHHPLASNSTNNAAAAETQAGIIDLKITKVGTLWRKSTKKKKTRSPWQEWGAVLTGSQLYLFKNAYWAKGLLHQFTLAQRPLQPRIPVIFKPPLQDFKPDALIKTDNAVALIDVDYTRHKHAFTFVRPGAPEEVLLADNEAERNDWLALINYAAAFRAAGVRIRGMVGGHEEDLRNRGIARMDFPRQETALPQTASSSNPPGQIVAAAVRKGELSPQLQRQVMAARHQIMVQKIAELDDEVVKSNRQLDGMLRNARHFLLLAPILPKSREDVVHAADRADASIKWLRRDIWKMRAHRDILAMDVQQDGLSAAELEVLSAAEQREHLRLQQQQHGHLTATAHESAMRDGVQAQRDERPSIALARYGSQTSAATSRSPPQSPISTTATARSHRFSANAESIDTFMGADVFRTPPESATQQQHQLPQAFGLPPLELDVRGSDSSKTLGRRTSVSSTLLSATTSSPGRASPSHASSASSTRPQHGERRRSNMTAEHNALLNPSNDQDRAIELLARNSIVAESSTSSIPATPESKTPQSHHHHHSSTRTSVRKSLQRTLREGPQHMVGGGSHHSQHRQHRRGRESDATIRSIAGGRVGNGVAEGGDELTRQQVLEQQQEDTPGLAREKERFILHGKQASVVHFGDGWWAGERMKARRETWRLNNAAGGGGSGGASPSEEPQVSPADPRKEGDEAGEEFRLADARAPIEDTREEPETRHAPKEEAPDPRADLSSTTFSAQRVLPDLVTNDTSSEGGAAEDSEGTSTTSAHERSLREDALAAETLAGRSTTTTTPKMGSFSSLHSSASSRNGMSAARALLSSSPFRSSSVEATPMAKRQTAIGPTASHSLSSATNGRAEAHGDGEDHSDTEDFSLGPRENRRTVLGPLAA